MTLVHFIDWMGVNRGGGGVLSCSSFVEFFVRGQGLFLLYLLDHYFRISFLIYVSLPIKKKKN